MLAEVFGPTQSVPTQWVDDPYRRAADERSGLYSCLIGAAANQSFLSGNAVRISELVSGLASPVVAPMPTRDMPVPMPMPMKV